MPQAKGIHQIVALTHIGNERDLALAAKVFAISAGATPANTPSSDQPDGIGKTCVVQAGSYAQAIGLAQVSFDGQGHNNLLASRDFFADAAHKQPLDENRSKEALDEETITLLRAK